MQTNEKKESTVERETDGREKEMARERQNRERKREHRKLSFYYQNNVLLF